MQKNYFWFVLSIGVWFIESRPSHAFPEMVRHGYANCITCHISPDGGGVLTAYGRSLSREVLSTWGAEGEAVLHDKAVPRLCSVTHAQFATGGIRTPGTAD